MSLMSSLFNKKKYINVVRVFIFRKTFFEFPSQAENSERTYETEHRPCGNIASVKVVLVRQFAIAF